MATTFQQLKDNRFEDAVRIMREAARLDRTHEEHVAGYHVRTRVQNALRYIENDKLADKIRDCSRSARCQSLWCSDCRRTAADAIERQMRKRLVDDEDLYRILSGEVEIDRESDAFNSHMNSSIHHVSGYVGLVSLDADNVRKGLEFDKRRWKRIRERKHSSSFWIAGNYELELVNYRYLLQSTNPGSDKKQLQIAQLLKHSIDQGWITKGENIGVLLHWHAVSNADKRQLEDAIGTAYWLGDQRLYKSGSSGLYVQRLHASKSFDKNIQKLASYALKSATRYKHSFTGSDVGDELMLNSELGALIGLYHSIQGRSWRSLVLTHSMG